MKNIVPSGILPLQHGNMPDKKTIINFFINSINKL